METMEKRQSIQMADFSSCKNLPVQVNLTRQTGTTCQSPKLQRGAK
jgi:hypothetical protein